jgi:hypothetical protein
VTTERVGRVRGQLAGCPVCRHLPSSGPFQHRSSPVSMLKQVMFPIRGALGPTMEHAEHPLGAPRYPHRAGADSVRPPCREARQHRHAGHAHHAGKHLPTRERTLVVGTRPPRRARDRGVGSAGLLHEFAGYLAEGGELVGLRGHDDQRGRCSGDTVGRRPE